MMSRPPLEKVRAQHFELRHWVDSLQATLKREVSEESRAADATRMREDLETLQAMLPEHFALEEEGGYFSDILAVAPRLTRQVERLQANHPVFLEQSRDLIALLREAPGSAGVRGLHARPGRRGLSRPGRQARSCSHPSR
jgi:hypothetical protein